MKRTLISVVIVIFLSLIYSRTGLAEEPVSFSLGANSGYLSGFTLYHISGSADFPLVSWESELEFPLDSWMGSLNASLGKKGVWSIDLSLSKNLTGDTGKMKDSDWFTVGYGYIWDTGNTREKVIYSESDTEMDAFLLDLNGKFYFLKREHVSLGPIGGYRYQNLSFDISNLVQTSILPGHTGSVSGKVGTYEITYSIPYGGIALDLRPSNRFSINLSAAYGWAFAEDEDDHILRSKRSTAESDGPFYSLKALGNLSLSQSLSILMALEYLKMDTDGKQTQTFYATTSEAVAGETYTDIDYKAKSEQTYVWAGIKYIF